MAMIIELIMKKELSPVGMPTVNMWCAQTKGKNAMPASRSDGLVTEDRFAGEDGEDLRDDPHATDHDVDSVPEEPEDVLVEDRAAAPPG
jgi:hypothetical protein